MSVLCFGNLQFDILCRTVTDLPDPGELRVIDSIDFALSGNGGSVAASLSKLGIQVELAGYSGADSVGEQFRSQLTELGVGTNKLLRHPTASTGTSVITLRPDGERSIILVNGANSVFDLDTVPDSWLADVELIAVLSVFILPQFTGESVGRLFSRARARGIRTLLNICWDTQERGLPFLLPALKQCDYFILNADEGRQLTGERDAEQIVTGLQKYTDGVVIVTLGPQGCCWLDNGTLHSTSGHTVTAVDSTGAGDAFIAGVSAGIVTGHSLKDCAQFGNIAGSFAVTGPGAYERMPTLTEIKHLAQS